MAAEGRVCDQKVSIWYEKYLLFLSFMCHHPRNNPIALLFPSRTHSCVPFLIDREFCMLGGGGGGGGVKSVNVYNIQRIGDDGV